MYESLKEHTADFHLYIFAFDELSDNILRSLNLKYVTVIALKDFEDDNLLNIKSKRSKAEYCWTCTPSTIYYVLENYKVTNCTYVDADLYFYQSPEILIQEMYNAGKNVMITEHRYNKLAKIRDEKRAGRFCVQFITFTQDKDSKEVLKTWKDQCINWCYARYEDGKFGDQKYLDQWPDKYNNVHILNHLGGGIAPWNVNQYKFKFRKDHIIGTKKSNMESFNMIFYHFHFVRFISACKVDIGWNYLSKFTIRNIYKPYIKNLLRIEENLEVLNSSYKKSFYSNTNVGVKNRLKLIIKNITRLNIIIYKS